jgi:hypothetical protein
VAVHAAEREWIENVAVQNRERPVPGFDLLVGGSAQAGRVLADGDVISLKKDHRLDLFVFHTPGHSPGSVALLLKGDGVLFSGDAVPVPGDLPVYDDALASVRSLKRLSRIDGITTLLASWDEPRQGILVYQAINDGLLSLRQVHKAVIAAAGKPSLLLPMAMKRRTRWTSAGRWPGSSACRPMPQRHSLHGRLPPISVPAALGTCPPADTTGQENKRATIHSGGLKKRVIFSGRCSQGNSGTPAPVQDPGCNGHRRRWFRRCVPDLREDNHPDRYRHRGV